METNAPQNHTPAFVIEKSEPQSIFGTHDATPVIETPVTLGNSIEISIPTTPTVEIMPEKEDLWQTTVNSTFETNTIEINPTPIIGPETIGETSTPLIPANNTDSFSLFGSLSDDNEIPVSDIQTSEAWTMTLPEAISESESMVPQHPQEFIEKSIAEIDAMMRSIQEARMQKIQEAESYGQEKERQAQLEHTAYEDATVMDHEIAHAERMKQLLEKELSGSDTPTTIESTTTLEIEKTTESLISNPIPSVWNPEGVVSNDSAFILPEKDSVASTSEAVWSEIVPEKLAA